MGSGASANLTGNVFTRNGFGIRGYEVDDESGAFLGLIRGNTLTRNRDAIYLPDGDLPEGPTGWSLGGNRALDNAGWGIYAPRATDLGGNVARRNGNSPQCVGVAC